MENEDRNWKKQNTQDTDEYCSGIYSIIHNNNIHCYNSLHRKIIRINYGWIQIYSLDVTISYLPSNSWCLNQYRSPTDQLPDVQQLNQSMIASQLNATEYGRWEKEPTPHAAMHS